MAKAPQEIRSLARSYSHKAIKVLAGIMQQEKAPAAARAIAANSLLDRGWGKPTQPLAGEDGAALQIQQVIRVIVEPKSRDSDR